jgi:hypothetical protein
MKNILKIKGIIMVIFLSLVMSCNDDFLKEEPKSFLSPENTFVDATGLQTVLDAALRGVYNQFNGDNEEHMFNHNMSDATVVSATDKQDAFVDLVRYATPQNSRDNDAGRTRSFYKENYIMIKNCNTVIDYIDIPEWTDGENDSERNHLLGTAYMLRAFYYMQLTMQFGNVALPLNVITKARQDFKAFHMQGIWDQMIADLEYAVNNVKGINELPKGQAPKAVARVLLAKYYMLNEKFAQAEEQMDIVIEQSGARLWTDADVDVATVRVGNNINPYPDNNDVIPGRDCNIPADAINHLHTNFGQQKLNNPEGLWLFPNVPFVDGNISRSARIRAWGPNFVSTNMGVKSPSGANAADIRQGQDTKQMHKWGRGQGFARPTNYSQYEVWRYNGVLDVTDYRHKDGNWFDMDHVIYDNPEDKDADFFHTPYKLWDNGTLLCEDTVRCWYGYPLYKFYAPNDEDAVKRQDGGKQDIYIMRLAEAYLIRAEARFWQNDNQGAADDINIIRERANATYMFTAADIQTGGIGVILDERVRELFGEEFRHDEMVRMSVIFAKTGKSCYNGKTYTLSGNDIETSLSAGSFYYDRMMEKNNFFRENVHWANYPDVSYTINTMHIFWPVYENYLIGNVGNVLNQTTGYDGAQNNVEPLTHVVQSAGLPNIDPMVAIGEIEE